MAVWGRQMPHYSRTAAAARRQDGAENAQRRYLWNSPDGNHPDFSETFTHGDEILISWNALNNSIYDLWLTSWNFDPDPVALCLARAVNLAHDGSLKLVTADPPSPELADKTRYVLRFKPPTGRGEFAASDPDLSSPGFLLVRASTGKTDVPTTTEPNAGPTAQTGLRATPSREIASTTPDSAESVHDMSPGAAVGLTVGLILFVALLVAAEVAYFVWRRKRRRGEDEKPGSSQPPSRRKKRHGKGERGLFIVDVDKTELTGALWMSPELPGDSDWGQRLVHELQGSRLGRGDPLGRTLTVNSSLVELEAGRR